MLDTFIISLSLIALALLAATVASAADTAPVSEPARIFDARAHGAAGDGRAVDTKALQKAIDACAAAGGGRVLLPPGRYLSATLRMRSGVDLHVAEGARLIGVPDTNDYSGFDADSGYGKPAPSRWLRALIIGDGVERISFSGKGVIDGNRVFDPQGEEKMRGPHAILLRGCSDVTLRDLTMRDAANYAFLFYHSRKVRVSDVTFEGGWDGVHFRGSLDDWNRDVRIERCRFYTGDDSIAGSYIEDATIEDCLINSSCNGVRVIGPARRVTFGRLAFFGPGLFPHRTSNRTNMLAALCLQPSAWGAMPGPMEDIRVHDVTMRNVACAFHIVTRAGNTARNLLFERVRATGIYRAASSVESWGEKTFADVTFRDISLEYTGGGISAEASLPVKEPGADCRALPAWGFLAHNAQGVALERVRLTVRAADLRPVLRADGVDRLRLDRFEYTPPPAGVQALALTSVTIDRESQ